MTRATASAVALRLPSIDQRVKAALAALAVILTMAFAVSPAAGQVTNRPDQALPAAKDLFERYIEAVGGRDKVFSTTRRYYKGVYDGAPFANTVSLSLWQDAPNLWHLRVAEPAGRQVDICYDGAHAWQAMAPGKSEWLKGSRRDEVVANADFYAEAGYETRYKSIKTIATAVFQGQPCYLVGAETPAGRNYVVAFNQDTGLLAGVQAFVIEDDAEIPFTVTFDAYKEFDGLMIPTEITQQVAREGARTSVWRIRSVEINPDEKHDYSAPDELGPPPATDG